MSKKDLILPEHMKKESVDKLENTLQNRYDYKKVDISLNEATEKMLNNSKKIMNPRVLSVVPNSNFTLTLTFSNQEIRIFDMKSYLEIGFFKELQNLDYFNEVKVVHGSIQWPNGQDICPDRLYNESKKLNED